MPAWGSEARVGSMSSCGWPLKLNARSNYFRAMLSAKSTLQGVRRARPRRRGRPRNADASAATRIDILKSAAAAFRRLGYHGATVEQIAAALQMKKGNLYYYFRNKEDILFACHQYSLDRLLELLDEVDQSGVAPEKKLRRLTVSFVYTLSNEIYRY